VDLPSFRCINTVNTTSLCIAVSVSM
jgi:hypothetical protein